MRSAFIILLTIVCCGTAFCQTTVLVDTFPVDAEIRDITHYVSHFYFACGREGIRIYNFSHPYAPFQCGEIDLAGEDAVALTIANNILFVSLYDKGVRMFSLGYPPELRLLTTIEVNAYVVSIEAHEPYLFLGCGYDGIKAINYLTSFDEFIFESNQDGYVADVAYNGSTLAAASGQGGTHLYQITGPDTIEYVSTFYTGGFARAVTFAQDHLFIADSEEGGFVVNVEDPAHPTDERHILLEPQSDVTSSKGKIVFSGAGMTLFDPDDLTAPDMAISCTRPILHTVPFGNYLIGNLFRNGFCIVERREDISPQEQGRAMLEGFARRVEVKHDLAFVAMDSDGLAIVDISNPVFPNVRSYFTGYNVRDVAVNDDASRVYLADPTGGFIALDVSQPAYPGLAARKWGESGNAYALDYHNELLSAASGFIGLKTYDVTTPESIATLGIEPSLSYSLDVELDWPIGYMSDFFLGSLVYDLTNPNAPEQLGSVLVPFGWRLKIKDDHLYQTSLYFRLSSINVRDPSNPYIVSEIQELHAVALDVYDDDILLVACGTDGLCVVDASDKSNLRVIGWFNFREGACLSDVTVAGDIAYLAYGTEGLLTVDLSPLKTLHPTAVATERWMLYQ